MKGSFKIASIAGTEVRVHLTFFILLVFIAIQGAADGRGAAGAVEAMVMVLSMFLCVVLHEFGHVFAARGYGIRTPDITLLPIGGLARLERMPSRPSQELFVAIAGPLVNVVIAAAIALALGIGQNWRPDLAFHEPGGFWPKLMTWNLFMVVFNLIPAFPMDGGRIFRALLGFLMDYGRATRAAALLGQGIAMVVVLYMLMGGSFNPFLILIAFFIFWAAGQEAAVVTQREATRNLLVRDAMLTEFHRLPPHAVLQDAVDFLLAGTQQDFPVLQDGGGMAGLITRHRLISSLAAEGPSCPVADVVEPCAVLLRPDEPLPEALEKLQSSACPALPVVDTSSGALIGLLTAENVGETLLVRAALRESRHFLAPTPR